MREKKEKMNGFAKFIVCMLCMVLIIAMAMSIILVMPKKAHSGIVLSTYIVVGEKMEATPAIQTATDDRNHSLFIYLLIVGVTVTVLILTFSIFVRTPRKRTGRGKLWKEFEKCFGDPRGIIP
jgi:hypothetical protein